MIDHCAWMLHGGARSKVRLRRVEARMFVVFFESKEARYDKDPEKLRIDNPGKRPEIVGSILMARLIFRSRIMDFNDNGLGNVG